MFPKQTRIFITFEKPPNALIDKITIVFQDFVSLFYPNYCFACDDSLVNGEEIICTRCLLEMPKTDFHIYPENEFYRKLYGRIRVEHVMALFKFSKNSRVQQLLHTLKYGNRPEIGVKLGNYYGSILKNDYANKFDLVIPVPLHKSRQRQRGYNQSAEFGRGLAETLSIVFDSEVLERITVTETQTKKTKLLRWKNVKHVFNVRNSDCLIGKRVLLVDDVITTGATLEACAEKILEHRVQALSIACIAAAQ